MTAQTLDAGNSDRAFGSVAKIKRKSNEENDNKNSFVVKSAEQNFQHAIKRILEIHIKKNTKMPNVNPPLDITYATSLFRLEAKKPMIEDTAKHITMQVTRCRPISSRQSLQSHPDNMKVTY